MRSPYDDPAYRKARTRLRGLPCVNCGQPSDTVDHRVSLILGGSNDASNYQPMCKSCNSSKGATTRHRLRRRPERNRRYR